MKHHHPAIQQHFNSPLTMSGLGQVYKQMAQGAFANSINNTIKKFNAIKAGETAPSKIKVGTTASNRAKLLKILQADRPDTSRAAMNKAKLHKAISK